MRFELYLRDLPNLRAAEAKTLLADLPKGFSIGVVVKALQDHRVPTVSVAFSDDKRIINEIEDRLAKYGATCYVKDRGNPFARVATFTSEKLRGKQYRDEDDDEERSYIKMGFYVLKNGADKLPNEGVLGHLVRCFMQVAVVSVLFMWRIALKVGLKNLMDAKWLTSLVAACAFGSVMAYVLTSTGRAVREGKIKLAFAVPLITISLGCTIASFLYLGPDQKEGTGAAVGRPPSNPYAGLLTELRRRKASGEQGKLNQDESAEDEWVSEEQTELWCVDTSGWDRGVRECGGGLSWDDALACLQKPPLPPPPKVKRWKPEKPKVTAAVPVPVKRMAVRPWALRLQVEALEILALLWLASLGALFFVQKRRFNKLASAPASSEPAAKAVVEAAAPAVQDPPAQPAVAPDPVVLKENEELKQKLGQVYAAYQQVAGQLTQLTQQRFGGEAEGVQVLQRELAQTRAALSAHQEFAGNLRQQLIAAREMLATQADEVERSKREFEQVTEQLTATRQMLRQSLERTTGGFPANNQVERPFGAGQGPNTGLRNAPPGGADPRVPKRQG